MGTLGLSAARFLSILIFCQVINVFVKMNQNEKINNSEAGTSEVDTIAQILDDLVTRVSEFQQNPGMHQDENTNGTKINTCQSIIAQILDDLVTNVIVSELFSSTRSSSSGQHLDSSVYFTRKPLTITDAQSDEESKIASSTIRSLLGEMLDFVLRVRSSIIIQNDELNTVSQIFCVTGPSDNTIFLEEIKPSRVQVCRSSGASCSTFDDLRLKQVPTRKAYSTILPSYSTVLSLGPLPKVKACASSGSFIPRVPPPSYAEVEGIWEDPPSLISSESAIFGTAPIYIICPRCRTVVVTHIERARSHMTHIMALILCVFMCWPCAVLPYCMKSCNYTHHSCPNCRYYFGTHQPFN